MKDSRDMKGQKLFKIGDGFGERSVMRKRKSRDKRDKRLTEDKKQTLLVHEKGKLRIMIKAKRTADFSSGLGDSIR